jgi:hypothetical protein
MSSMTRRQKSAIQACAGWRRLATQQQFQQWKNFWQILLC